MSRYAAMERFGSDLLSRSRVDLPKRETGWSMRRKGLVGLAALALLGGGGVVGAAIANEDTGAAEVFAPAPGAYEATIEKGLSIPVITRMTDADGNYVYGPYDCPEHAVWFEESIAPNWLNGVYSDPSEFPKPPEGICD